VGGKIPVTPSAAERLDELRRLAARYGVAVELFDREVAPR
jgi:hypothetical protein